MAWAPWVDGDVFPLQCHHLAGGLPENEDERGHQAIFSGHVGMSEQSLKLFYLFVSGFLLGGVSPMGRDLQLRQPIALDRPGQESGQ
jgi:hypothetical protein